MELYLYYIGKKIHCIESIDDYISSLSCWTSENVKIDTLFWLSEAIEIVKQPANNLEMKYRTSNDENI